MAGERKLSYTIGVVAISALSHAYATQDTKRMPISLSCADVSIVRDMRGAATIYIGTEAFASAPQLVLHGRLQRS